MRGNKVSPNKITMNCANYERTSCNRPINCYNCLRRNGYPWNLGGDKACVNYKQKYTELAKHAR